MATFRTCHLVASTWGVGNWGPLFVRISASLARNQQLGLRRHELAPNALAFSGFRF